MNNKPLYISEDGNSRVTLYARDGSVWLNQLQMAELFATSKPNISMHISSILKDRELDADSVVKEYLTTESDGKKYKVTFYSLVMAPSATNKWKSLLATYMMSSMRVASNSK